MIELTNNETFEKFCLFDYKNIMPITCVYIVFIKASGGSAGNRSFGTMRG